MQRCVQRCGDAGHPIRQEPKFRAGGASRIRSEASKKTVTLFMEQPPTSYAATKDLWKREGEPVRAPNKLSTRYGELVRAPNKLSTGHGELV